MEHTAAFEAERPRLTSLAARVLGDRDEAQDVVQQSWLRLNGTQQSDIANLPAWLTTVTMRLCLDRLRARVPEPVGEDADREAAEPDPADEVALADTVAVALHVVLDRLTPAERVAFVLHDSFGFDFETISAVLNGSPAAARKLASRARAKVAQPSRTDALARWEVVDAFLAAARGGDLAQLLELLAPNVVVTADADAIALGTPERIAGRQPVADFFNGAAKATRSVFVAGRPGAAWMQRGKTMLAFDFDIADGQVRSITFRADPTALDSVQPRTGGSVPMRSTTVTHSSSDPSN